MARVKKLILIGGMLSVFSLLLTIFIFRKNHSNIYLSSNQNLSSNLILQLKKRDHIRGAKNPKVLIIEYSDFECPFCKKFLPTLKEIIQDENLQAAVVFRHFPLPFHQNAKVEAEASECVYDAGGSEKFWQFHDLLFERTKSTGIGFSPEKLAPLAQEIGLDSNSIQDCINSGKFTPRVQEDIDTGSRLGISGTPTTVIMVSSGKHHTVVGSVSDTDIRNVISSLK